MLHVAASGSYILGSPVEELERQLADYVGVRHCIACSSGTDALLMSLMALGIGPDDAVFVPDFTFFATAEAVARVGATPIFIDVNKENYNIDVEDLARKLEHVRSHTEFRPVAVIAVDLFGLPADYPVLRPFCQQQGLRLIEDGAQGFGGAIGGMKACAFGDIAITSFFPSKPLGCMGDGGALFTDDDGCAELLRSLRVHGKGIDKYDNVRLGLNARLDTLQAAVLQVKMQHFEAELQAVEEVAQNYNTLLRGAVGIPAVPTGFRSSWAQYTVRLASQAVRDNVRKALENNGIASAVYYPRTMSEQPAFAGICSLQQPCPVAERLAQTVLSLPMHPYLREEEVQQVANIIVSKQAPAAHARCSSGCTINNKIR